MHVKIAKRIKPYTISKNQALKLEAIRACKDWKGVERSAGEQWLIREPGFYIPRIDEEFLEKV